MSETSLSALVKEIGEALKLDDTNNDKAAYTKYISCIYKIATNLILAVKLAGGDIVVDSKTSKQVKLVQQCVDRVIALVEKMESTTSKSVSTTVQQPLNPATVTSSRGTVFPNNRGVISKPAQTVQSSPKPSSGQTLKFTQSESALVLEKNPYSYNRSHVLSPMDVARTQNQSLMAAYKARMERLNRSDFNAFNYSLTIQRKMAENIAIAQAQEEELARKMQVRNMRLEEEAAKRFATPIGMSKEEQEQRQIYKKILEYENEAKWLKNWRNKLEASPEDPILINQLVQEILRCSDHPITELLHKYQSQIYQRLYPLVANKHEKIDLVRIPLPFSDWPSVDDVEDIFTGVKRSTTFQRVGSLSRSKEDISMSTTSSEDGSKNKDKSLQVSEVGEIVDLSKKGFKSDVTHVSDHDCGVDSSDRSQKNDMTVSSASDLQNLEFASSENSLQNTDSEAADSLTISPKDTYERCDEKNSDINALSCNQQAPSDKIINSHIEVDESKKIFNEPSPLNDDKLNSQLCKQDKVSLRSEDIPAETNSIEPTHISQQIISGSDSHNMRPDNNSVVENLKPKTGSLLEPNTDKGLESQVSWERRQAQLLMRQVTKDYTAYRLGDTDYDENNLDYLFDDNDDEDDSYGWLTNRENTITTSSETHAPASKVTQEDQGHSVNRSVSHTPITTQGQADIVAKFQSLPANLSPGFRSPQDKEFDKLSQDAYQRHLSSISDDIHRYLEKLLVLMTIAYEPLDTPIGKDQCAVSLEEPFFKPIWKTLLRLFRVVNHKQELVLACVMTKYAGAKPEEFKVSKKLWLTDSLVKPYQSAITELINVTEHYTMLSKLDCIVRVCRLICECVDHHYNHKDELGLAASKKAPSVGADDLLPILTYVIVQSAIPQLSSECHAMTEFIHEGYMMGEEGYCLTSLRTALNYVNSMYPSIAKSGSHDPSPS